MSTKRKAISRAELVAHFQSGGAARWLESANHNRAAVSDDAVCVYRPGNTADEIVELLRLRDLLERGEPLRSLDRGNLLQLVQESIGSKLKKSAGAPARAIRDPFIALDYALRKWASGDGNAARTQVAQRWGIKPSNVARIWTYHDQDALGRLQEMRKAARKTGGTSQEQLASMMRLADTWPATVARLERMVDQLGDIYIPGIDLRQLLRQF